MAQRRLRMRYKVTGPTEVDQVFNKCEMIDGNLEQKLVKRKVQMYMVYLPAGHSIRVDRAELKRLGFHIKPRLVDMDTGDVVDIGGEEYNLDDVASPEDATVEDEEVEFEPPLKTPNTKDKD